MKNEELKTRIMLDLETLGNKPGSVILAIGAVKFGGGQIHGCFYERVDAESCMALGLRMDAATVLWWLKQNDAARNEITQPGGKLSEVLLRFSTWVSMSKSKRKSRSTDTADAEIWGNGASFDNVLLAEAYERAQLPRPWKYYNDRCYRTVKNLHPGVPLVREGTHHNALNDAESQARHLMLMVTGL